MRYTDDKSKLLQDNEFVQRNRVPTLVQLIFSCGAATALIITAAMLIDHTVGFAFVVLLVVGGFTSFSILSVQRARDQMLATEFQNALFASALGLNNKFCLIARKGDGTIVYLDRGFQSFFPDFMRVRQRTIDVMLEMGRVSKEESQKITAALGRGAFDRVIFTLQGSQGKPMKMVMTIDPIARPSGFMLLRGREFVERLGAQDAPASSKPATLPYHLLHQLPVGLYMTDTAGRFTYANPRLEEWLGYGEGEIILKNLSLQDVLRGDGLNPSAPGEASINLQSKTGPVLEAYVQQDVAHDASGQVTGFSGVVHWADAVKKNSLAVG